MHETQSLKKKGSSVQSYTRCQCVCAQKMPYYDDDDDDGYNVSFYGSRSKERGQPPDQRTDGGGGNKKTRSQSGGPRRQSAGPRGKSSESRRGHSQTRGGGGGGGKNHGHNQKRHACDARAMKDMHQDVMTICRNIRILPQSRSDYTSELVISLYEEKPAQLASHVLKDIISQLSCNSFMAHKEKDTTDIIHLHRKHTNPDMALTRKITLSHTTTNRGDKPTKLSDEDWKKLSDEEKKDSSKAKKAYYNRRATTIFTVKVASASEQLTPENRKGLFRAPAADAVENETAAPAAAAAIGSIINLI